MIAATHLRIPWTHLKVNSSSVPCKALKTLDFLKRKKAAKASSKAALFRKAQSEINVLLMSFPPLASGAMLGLEMPS